MSSSKNLLTFYQELESRLSSLLVTYERWEHLSEVDKQLLGIQCRATRDWIQVTRDWMERHRENAPELMSESLAGFNEIALRMPENCNPEHNETWYEHLYESCRMTRLRIGTLRAQLHAETQNTPI